MTLRYVATMTLATVILLAAMLLYSQKRSSPTPARGKEKKESVSGSHTPSLLSQADF
jgi:hypothetical protein